MLIRNSNKLSELEEASGRASLSYRATPSIPPVKPMGMHLDISDIIHPNNLNGKIYGQDYVFLRHHPYKDEERSKIRLQGLKSLKKLNSEPDAEEYIKEKFYEKYNQVGESKGAIDHTNVVHFTVAWARLEDLVDDNIFKKGIFREEFDDSCLIGPKDFVIAAHPNSVNVFSQEARNCDRQLSDTDSDNEESHKIIRDVAYRNTSLNINSFADKIRTIKPNLFIDMYGNIKPKESKLGSKFPYIQEACVVADIIPPEMFVDHEKIPAFLKKELDE